MSKFQIALTYIKKYIFWVISLVCLLLTMIVSNVVTGSKADNFESRQSAIQGRFTEMQSLAGRDTPNEQVVLQKKEDVQNLKDTIVGAWSRLYAPQSAFFENGWPEFRNKNGELDANAMYYLDELKKIWGEQSIYEAQGQSILPNEVTDAYRNYVTQSQERDFMIRYKIYVPENLQGANGTVLATAMQKLTDQTGTMVQLPTEGNLTWDETNRQQMLNRFQKLNRALGNAKVNSTRKLLVVQEDIWMYNLILNAIAQMNADCEGSHDAVVKRIFEIDIADDASTLNPNSMNNKSERRSSMGTGLEKNQAVGFNAEERVITVVQPQVTNSEAMTEATMSEGEEEEGSSITDEEFLELFDYRYCDIYGNFMSATQLQEYLKSKPEYKLFPIHVHILIAQDKIPQFMLNCLNADMPIYIHQISMKARDLDAIPHHLKIEPVVQTTSEDEGGMMAPSSRQRRSERGMTPTASTEMGLTESMGVANNAGEIDKRKPGDVEFELWGMVCVFNAPDESKFDEILGESGESAESSEDEEESEDEESEDDVESSEDVEDSEDLSDSDTEEVETDADTEDTEDTETEEDAEEDVASQTEDDVVSSDAEEEAEEDAEESVEDE